MKGGWDVLFCKIPVLLLQTIENQSFMIHSLTRRGHVTRSYRNRTDF